MFSHIFEFIREKHFYMGPRKQINFQKDFLSTKKPSQETGFPDTFHKNKLVVHQPTASKLTHLSAWRSTGTRDRGEVGTRCRHLLIAS